MAAIRNLSFLVLLWFALSCSSIEPLSVTTIESVKIENFSSGVLALKVEMKVKNPNNVKIKVKENNLNLSLNGSEIGTARIKDQIVIRRKSEETHTFVVEAKFSKLALGAIPSLLNMIQTKAVEIKLKGDVKISSFGFSKTHPIEIVEKVNFGK